MNMFLILFALVLLPALDATAQVQPVNRAQNPGKVRLADVRMRDVFILADETSRTYYAVSSTFVPSTEGRGRPAVRAYTSKDLVTWEGPHVIFQTPTGFWGDANIRGIWAPELHSYKGKYYLIATFDTDSKLSEQWRNWLPRVKRGTQVLVSNSPLGPFEPFHNHSTLPADMMTLDGTLWIEDGVPYMVFCHEWVQIKDGTVELVQLKEDLSETVGEPVHLFNGSDASWSRKQAPYSCYVTDGTYLYRTKTGKLIMIWSSFGTKGYTIGIAVSSTGKVRGPWVQQDAPLVTDDGGHGMIFKRFDGQLMLVFHRPNSRSLERAQLFELEDAGDTLRLKGRFVGAALRGRPMFPTLGRRLSDIPSWTHPLVWSQTS
jgi:arabinan endo-1,5-alpha-L-arabinosidase